MASPLASSASAFPPPSALTLRPATDVEKLECWRANSVAWAGKLPTIEAYIARETLNGDRARTAGGGGNQGMIYWVLIGPRSNAAGGDEDQQVPKTGDMEIYSACETLRRPFLMRLNRPGAAEADSCVEGWTYGIASVFTPPRHRGKGYASLMLKQLAGWFDGQGSVHDALAENGRDLREEVPFSVLYSDVGDFYDHLGWPSFPTLEATLPAVPQSSTSSAAAAASTRVLALADLRSLCAKDTASMIAFVHQAPLKPEIDARVLFLPTFEQAMWHFGAEESIAQSIFPPSHTPSTKVEVKGAMSASGRTWTYWVHDFNDDKLTLLRTVSPLLLETEADTEGASSGQQELTEELAEVLRAAQSEAARWDLKKVTIWNPEPRTRAACASVLGLASGEDVIIHERLEGSIPCLRWKAGSGPREPAKTEWVVLEKYSWC